jgi:diphthine synthase
MFLYNKQVKEIQMEDKTKSKGELVFIGLGLYDEMDITQRGLQEIKKCDRVYAEFYTSKLVGLKDDQLGEKIGRTVTILNRDDVEKGDEILSRAQHEHVVLLVPGDPMTATTHIDLRLRALKKGIPTRVIHNSSIITAAPGLFGLQSYKFGRSTTLVLPEGNYFPVSPYHVIKENKERGLHTLVLLDIQSDKGRFMTANEGINLLLRLEKQVKGNVLSEDTLICVASRVGSPGRLHFMEIEALITIAHMPLESAEKIQKI